jgi:tripartite-type tricarboxylate transporter receptor subunit TctC
MPYNPQNWVGGNMKRNLGSRIILALAMLGGAAALGRADEWPTHSIRMLVGFGPGGGTDIAARFVAQPLSEILGQSVVVENRSSAGGITAAQAVALSPKDGSMALMMSNAHAISAVMFKTLPFDPINDFQMVSLVGIAGLVLVTAPDFPANNLQELIAVLRANPGKYNFGSAGLGTTQQFAAELLKQMEGIEATHIPYRSAPAAVNALLTKDVSFVFELVPAVQGQIQTGALKAIAVTSEERNPVLPSVPTFAEAGMPGYDVTSWYGVAFPAGTPMPIVDKTNKAMRALLAIESVRQQVLAMGAVARSSTPDELKTHVASEIARWTTVREKAGIEQTQ